MAARPFRLLIFDIDDTLVDFAASERAALADTRRRRFGAVDAAAFAASFSVVNRGLWSAFAAGAVSLPELRWRRFADTARDLGLPDDRAWMEIETEYEAALVRHARVLPGVVDALRRLAPRYRLAAISNGLANVQRPKVERTGLDALVPTILISEEEGLAKPDPAIFLRCLERTGMRAADALMVGDSLDIDGVGAAAAGVAFCWLERPDEAPRADGTCPIALRIRAVPELPDALGAA